MGKIMLSKALKCGTSFSVSLFPSGAQHRKGSSLEFALLGTTVAGMFQVHLPASGQERESCLVIYGQQHCPGECSAVTETLYIGTGQDNVA